MPEKMVSKSMVSDYGSVLESFRPAVSTVLGLDRERARRVLIIGAQIALLLVVLTRSGVGRMGLALSR